MIAKAALLLLSLAAIVMADAPRLVRRGLWRELAAFSVILAIGYTLAFLLVFGLINP